MVLLGKGATASLGRGAEFIMTLLQKNVQQELTTKVNSSDVSEVTPALGHRATTKGRMRLQAADSVELNVEPNPYE